ncbi:MAG: GxxExxY protein [Candidatus Marinimicrobia bacterium]|jgi:GxxExxY protein|nr:GxxExxY protein [Candidatus Neomarinimicrobiota bacterium]MBT4176713.1 GxxExxY protein [Candidatus Neomarinimicrobiota bacterium]MBT4593484.1 GxxExxY protein [Candidatus Neomarinimicrobiota bacterium]MBT4991547.1 GxxExxY protein [Candidatus Neomarinimicrobiota bacterium]MBT6159031.1 GxxExxY protein [Candidatus Neomarinimicrobiota bacterium]
MDIEIKKMTDEIRETAFSLHKYLKYGHLEKVYENGLAHRLKKKGYKVEQQFPLKVHDEDGTLLGDYFADLIINDYFIIELKACKTLADEHVAQILGYLRSANQEHGMLINFGSSKLQVRKYILSQKF